LKRVALLQGTWLALQAGATRRFRAALRDPAAAQQARLAALVGVLAGSRYGRHVGLAGVRTLSDLQHVPIVEAADLEPWVERVAAGETDVLSTEPVEVLEPTGGTTGGTRLVPTTARLRSEFAAAVAPWMHDLHRHRPRLFGTRQYWSISRAVRQRRRTTGGIPIGFDDDAAYFGQLERWAIRRMQVVSSEVAATPDAETWRFETTRRLLEADDLGLISIWSPTFLSVLMEWMEAHADRIRPVLTRQARDRFDAARRPEGLDGSRLWPRLQVISAWADGFAGSHVAPLMARFPGVLFQPKGLLATEGVVSVPHGRSDGHVLAVTSHVLELAEVEDGARGRVIRPEAAEPGGTYQPILTTGGGYVRYALPDAVQVVGFSGRVPRIRLLGRLDRGSDRVGEKLTEGLVDGALDGLWARRPGFAMLVPSEEPRAYTLVVDRDPPRPSDLDAVLSVAYHYRYARELGQLAEPQVVVRPDAWSRWERGVEQAGLVLGDQKPGPLETRSPVVDALLVE
jgi:hypothetical protein